MAALSSLPPASSYPLNGYIKGDYQPYPTQPTLPLPSEAPNDTFQPNSANSPYLNTKLSESTETLHPAEAPVPTHHHADQQVSSFYPNAKWSASTETLVTPHSPTPAEKTKIVYVDINAPDHKWLQHILEKTSLKPEDFLSNGKLKTHLTATAAAFKKGTIGTLAGAGVSGLGAIGTMASILAGAAPITGPASPVVIAMAAGLGSVPIIGGLITGVAMSKKDIAKNKAALAEMKANLVNNMDKYDAYFRRTKWTSSEKTAKEHNRKTAVRIENYLKSGSTKPMLWKVHLPVLPYSKTNMIITTANPHNAQQLLSNLGYAKVAKIVGDVAKDTAKKVAQQAVKA